MRNEEGGRRNKEGGMRNEEGGRRNEERPKGYRFETVGNPLGHKEQGMRKEE